MLHFADKSTSKVEVGIQYMNHNLPIAFFQCNKSAIVTGYNLIRLKKAERVPLLLLTKLAKWNPMAGFFDFLSFLLAKKRMYCPVFLNPTG